MQSGVNLSNFTLIALNDTTTINFFILFFRFPFHHYSQLLFMTNVDSLGQDSLAKCEAKLISREPEIVAIDAQVSSPVPPIFLRCDAAYQTLERPTEFAQIEKIQRKIDETKKYIPFLYSYRSISRAMNRGDYLKTTDKAIQAESMQIYNKFFEPQLNEILSLYNALNQAAIDLSTIITSFNGILPSCVFYEKLVEFLDVIFNLDQMKQIKSGLTNDLSYYRRETSLSQESKDITGEAAVFLGTRFYELTEIKKTPMITQTSPQTIELFQDFLQFCMSYHQRTILPKKKFSILISMVTVLYIFDVKKLLKDKELSAICQILAENPIVPLYGEITFKPFEVLKDNKTFQAPKGIADGDKNEDIKAAASKYLLQGQMSHFRTMYTENLSKAASISRRGSQQIESINDVINIMKCISGMASAILRQSAFKFALPATKKNQSFYDNQVRNNYSEEDKDLLIEMIGNLKTLAGFALKSEPAIMEYVYQYISKDIQDFVNDKLEQTIPGAKKAKEEDYIKVIEAIQNIFFQGKIESGKKKGTANLVVPSDHQLDVLRTSLSILTRPSSVLYEKKNKVRKQVSKSGLIDLINAFTDKTEHYYDLLNFAKVIRDASNLGSLWFREVCLDIENVLQFPVRSSLPFILVEHILNSPNKPGLHDSIFFPLEIYNDAASTALDTFKSQYLYKEISAEVTLCVDMTSFTFARTFFKFCQTAAACALLPPGHTDLFNQDPIRFSYMVKQSKFQLLGSPIDFNLLTSQKLNDTFIQELSDVVSKINDLRIIPLQNDLIQIFQKTHQLLVINGLFLDDFDTLWTVARGAAQPMTPISTLATCIMNAFDPVHLMFNCITRRFVSSKSYDLRSPYIEIWSVQFTKLHSQDANFIGSEHLEAIVELLDDAELTSIIGFLLGSIEAELQKAFDLYLQVVSSIRLFPPKNRDDLMGYFAFITDAYTETSHPQLGAFLNTFRVVGNLIAFIYLLQTVIPPVNGNLSLMGSVVDIIRNLISANKGLFITQEFDAEAVITHRTFPALWPVFEFLLCTPEKVKLSEKTLKKKLLEEFGDGVVICAYMIILLSGEKGIYDYDSLTNHSAAILKVINTLPERGSLTDFMSNVSVVEMTKNFTETMCTPYVGTLPPL